MFIDTESVSAAGFLKDTEVMVTDSKDKDAVTPQGIYRNMIKRFNHHSIMVLKACDRPENQTVANSNHAAAAASSCNGNKSVPPPSSSTDGPPHQNNNTTTENNNEPQLSKKKKKKRDKEREEILENGDAELYAIPPEAKKVKQNKKLTQITVNENEDAIKNFAVYLFFRQK